MESVVAMEEASGLKRLQTEGKRILWVGAASFEERSVQSLRLLKRSGIEIEKAVIILYETRVEPEREAEDVRKENLSESVRLAAEISRKPSDQVRIPAYAYGAARRFVGEQLSDTTYDTILFDVSCLTKIHSVALAATVGAHPLERDAVIAYTTAENYPGIAESDSRSLGWLDIIVAPLSTSARFFNESNSRGVIILGHESDRLIVGLAEIEPSGGAIVFPSAPLRPDIGEVSVRRNARVVRQLMQMRTVDWTKYNVGLMDLEAMERLVAREIDNARKHSAPVILFPYGPKSLLFISALTLARTYFDGSWFVYPIPASYDASYSEGIGELIWLRVSR